MPRTVVIGSRGSHLARAMTKELLQLLECAHRGVVFKQRKVMTSGDRDRKTQLSVLSGAEQGAFTTQLEESLRRGEIDVAVHSLKDLPTAMPDDLVLAAVPPRADPRDALCGGRLADLRQGARVGTGSPRRVAQLLALRPDLEVVPIRGNVPPRLQKLKGPSALDGVVLAAAGLQRLGLADQITELLPVEEFPPSPGQGALGVQVRADDAPVRALLGSAHDADAAAEVAAERVLLAELRGGCSVPIGAHATVVDGHVRLVGQVTVLDGAWFVRLDATGPRSSAAEVGRRLAHDLLAKGADRILADIRPDVGSASSDR